MTKWKLYLFNLKDKIAIITGASQGIGKSIAKIFSNAGAHVVCLARNKKKIQHLVDQISKDGNSASYIPCDISDSNLFSKAVKSVVEDFGKIDILINNLVELNS